MNLDELDPSPDRYEGLCAVQPDVALPGWESARRARQETKRRARETEGAEGECARPSETGDQRPPVIRVVQGELHNATGRKRFWLAARATSFGMVECSFERVSRTLVEKEGRTVPEGTLVLEPAGKEWLQIELCRLARWERAAVRRDGSVEWVPCDAPMKVASGILADIGGWQVPLLTAVTEIPILRPDGSICAEPGYDEVTGLFFDPGGAVFPPISERPGRDDAMAALASLEDLLKDFHSSSLATSQQHLPCC